MSSLARDGDVAGLTMGAVFAPPLPVHRGMAPLLRMPGPSEECRLCGTQATLQVSHILPRWTYRRVTQTGDGPNPVFFDGAEARLGGKQFAEPMLCEACEQRVGRWDDHASKLAVQADGTFPALRDARHVRKVDGSAWEEVDGSHMAPPMVARFAASVFWRASVARTFFKDISLGSYNAVFRDYLHRDDVPFPENARLLVELLQSTIPLDRMIIGPQQKKQVGFHAHRFCVFGLQFSLFVGSTIRAVFDHGCIVRTGRAFVTDGGPLARSVAEMVFRVEPKGALARRNTLRP